MSFCFRNFYFTSDLFPPFISSFILFLGSSDVIAYLTNLFSLFLMSVITLLFRGKIATVFGPVDGTLIRDIYRRINVVHYGNVIFYHARKLDDILLNQMRVRWRQILWSECSPSELQGLMGVTFCLLNTQFKEKQLTAFGKYSD